MITKLVTDDDHFLNLSSSAQALYLHLNMSADDDGFCNQISASMFKAHASVEDLEALLRNRYIYQFENGVIVIKHWRMAYALRKDRYTPTAFQEELAKLQLKDNGSYTLVADWLPDGCQMVATDKNRLDKNRLLKDIVASDEPKTTKTKRFVKPTIQEIKDYINEKNYNVDAERFFNYYESNGWRVGKNPMKSWKAALATWNSNESPKPKKDSPKGVRPAEIDWSDMEEWLQKN